jgi:hypothetical protein
MFYMSVEATLGWQVIPPCEGPVCKNCAEHTVAVFTGGGGMRLWNSPQWFCRQCAELVKEATGGGVLPEPEESAIVAAIMQAADAIDEI